jgi:hypothetical protein
MTCYSYSSTVIYYSLGYQHTHRAFHSHPVQLDLGVDALLLVGGGVALDLLLVGILGLGDLRLPRYKSPNSEPHDHTHSWCTKMPAAGIIGNNVPGE